MSRHPSSQTERPATHDMEASKKDRQETVQQRPGRNGRQKKSLATTKRNLRRSTRGRGAQASTDAALEEDESNGDDEDSGAEEDDTAKNADEPEVVAPSTGSDIVSSIIDDVNKTQERRSPRTGHTNHVSSEAVEDPSSTLALDENESNDATSTAYPRKQSSRRLSNNHGFLSYDDTLEDMANVNETVTIDTDDDDYTGVDQFYDSDTDDTKMQQLETEAIVGSSRNRDDPESLAEADFGAAASESASYFEDQMTRMPEDHSMFLLDVIAASAEQNANTRKVRFAESAVVHSSSSSETSEETVELPDIFTETSVNMQGLNNLNDDLHSPGSYANSEDGSYWDWTEDEVSKFSSPNGSFVANSSTFPLLPAIETEDDMETDEGSSSGYDTDASGETTDEEMPPPPKAPITPRATLRSYKPPTSRKPSFKHAGRPLRSFPIMGSFAVEKDKAIVLTRKYGTIVLRRGDPRHTRLVEQSESASTTQSSPTTPFQPFNADDSDYSEVSRTPITGSVDVMFGGMFGGAPNQTYNFGGQVIGPPEAFYPFKFIGEDGRLVDAEEGSYDDDDDDDDMEDNLDISNFIKGLSDNEDNGDDDTDMGMSFIDESESDVPLGLQSPALTDNSSVLDNTAFPTQNLYDHFSSPGLVNSFRRQQDHATRLQRLPHDPAQRTAASRPLRSGFNANSLITPSRRRKASRDEAPQMSFSSPVKSKIQKSRMMGPPPRPRLPKRGYF